MSNVARAAKIWAQLERQLVGLLMSGSRLDMLRPQLIRSIGNTLGGGELRDGEEKSQRQTQSQGQRQTQERQVMERLPAPPVKKPVVKDAGRGRLTVDRPTAGGRPPTFHDPVLALMLERSCSPRMGYDGDDEVSYARPR